MDQQGPVDRHRQPWRLPKASPTGISTWWSISTAWTARVRTTIAPSGSGSKVTWSFGYDSGTSPLKRWKALMLDGFVGAEYRTGLDRLKEKIESERRPTEPTISVAPEGGESSESEQPAAALPPGQARRSRQRRLRTRNRTPAEARRARTRAGSQAGEEEAAAVRDPKVFARASAPAMRAARPGSPGSPGGASSPAAGRAADR